MKKGIHPTYYPDAKVTCACGNTWTTGSTKKEIHTEVCSKCHPFFTGQQARIIDIEGQVDRFYKKLQARQEFLDQKKARDTERVSPQRPVAELNLGARPTDALIKAGLTTIGQVIERLAGGDDKLLEVEGFGRKSLIDAKKRMRQLGYELSTSEEVSA
ncbi:ribosomal protein L31 [Longilinea arvoryzae]|uniref:Large ribosomal subunit protein bL31 n=1 Tax=Longilinea arvoryzae TaxID=360412 RepID=A0A0S7BFC5_9CHLR|nr:ribosomal protein L31 [Longilinea arvoryzae]